MKKILITLCFLVIIPINQLNAENTEPAPTFEAKAPYTLNTAPITAFFDRLAAWPEKIFNTLDSWGQRWVIVFTRDPFTKAQRSLNAANEKLELATATVRRANSPEVLLGELTVYLRRYTAFTDTAVSRIRELTQKDATVEYQQLIQNYSLQQLKNQQELRSLSAEASTAVAGQITQAKERGLTQFAGILSELDPETISSLLQNATLTQTDVSDLLAALATIKEMEQKLPASLRQTIIDTEKKIIQRLIKEGATSANPLLKQELPQLKQMLQNL